MQWGRSRRGEYPKREKNGMKKYLKAVVSGLCAAALALGCVGCGGGASQTAKPAQVTNITV